MTEWDSHKIASFKNSILLKGRPFIMYTVPEMYGRKVGAC